MHHVQHFFPSKLLKLVEWYFIFMNSLQQLLLLCMCFPVMLTITLILNCSVYYLTQSQPGRSHPTESTICVALTWALTHQPSTPGGFQPLALGPAHSAVYRVAEADPGARNVASGKWPGRAGARRRAGLSRIQA